MISLSPLEKTTLLDRQSYQQALGKMPQLPTFWNLLYSIWCVDCCFVVLFPATVQSSVLCTSDPSLPPWGGGRGGAE